MVIVRLARGGAKKHPFYHIVVTDTRRSRDSGYIEKLGYFNPFATEKEVPVVLNLERFNYWISKGAQSSQRVSSIIAKSDKAQFINKAKTKPDAQTKKTTTESIQESSSTETTEQMVADAATATAAEEQEEVQASASQPELELQDSSQRKQEKQQTTLAAEEAESEDKVPPAEAIETNKKSNDK